MKVGKTFFWGIPYPLLNECSPWGTTINEALDKIDFILYGVYGTARLWVSLKGSGDKTGRDENNALPLTPGYRQEHPTILHSLAVFGQVQINLLPGTYDFTQYGSFLPDNQALNDTIILFAPKGRATVIITEAYLANSSLILNNVDLIVLKVMEIRNGFVSLVNSALKGSVSISTTDFYAKDSFLDKFSSTSSHISIVSSTIQSIDRFSTTHGYFSECSLPEFASDNNSLAIYKSQLKPIFSNSSIFYLKESEVQLTSCQSEHHFVDSVVNIESYLDTVYARNCTLQLMAFSSLFYAQSSTCNGSLQNSSALFGISSSLSLSVDSSSGYSDDGSVHGTLPTGEESFDGLVPGVVQYSYRVRWW